MKHTKDYVENLVKRIGDSDWYKLEKSGQYVKIAFSNYAEESQKTESSVINKNKFIVVDLEKRLTILLVYEDQYNKLWILWDTVEMEIIEKRGCAWMLPLHIFAKQDEYVYYAAESFSDKICGGVVYRYKNKIVKIGGELELQNYYDKNTTAEFNFKIFKVPNSIRLGEKPKLDELLDFKIY